MSECRLSEPVTETRHDISRAPGTILPHGAMLVCEPVSLDLRHVSTNFSEITKFEGDLFPGMALGEILGREAVHELRNAAARSGSGARAGLVLGLRLPWSARAFDATIHTQGDACLIELEPARDGDRSAGEALELTRQLVGRLEDTVDAQRLLATGALLVQAMLGFERVTIHRYGDSGPGEIVAEARLASPDSGLDDPFPAAEMSAEARALCVANPVRSVPDTGREAVPLVPPLPVGADPVDMSFALLRNLAPAQRDHLRNAGVSAALTISLVVDGRFWGVIACHHHEPRHVPAALRISAELFGHCFAQRISAAERHAEKAARADAREYLDRLLEDIEPETPLAWSLAARLPALAELAGCDGAALLKDGEWAATPEALPREAGLRLLELARAEHAGGIWHTRSLAQMLPDLSFPADSGFAGALLIRLADKSRDALFLFRRDEDHDAPRADTPLETMLDAQGRLHFPPRTDLDPWGRARSGRAPTWSAHDLAVAEELRSWLRDLAFLQNEAAARERAETDRRQRIVTAELNHRVKNVLSMVKSIAFQTGTSATSVAQYRTALEGRLHALAGAHDRSLGERGGSLSDLIEAEAVLHRSDAAPDRILAEGPPLRLDDKAHGVLALVLHEMMTNAVKYGSLSVPEGRLALRWSFEPARGLVLDWRESGGPQVAPPRRAGFGSRLIRSTLEYDLKGQVEIDYALGGLKARIAIPALRIAPVSLPASPPRPSDETAKASLLGLSVLVVEDQGLIAIDTEETLRHLGATDVRLTPGAAEALALLEAFSPDLAVLDINLGDENSEAVARELVRRKLPFLFMTGYSDQVMPAPEFRRVPVLRKPVSASAIAGHVAAARVAAATP